MGQYYNVILWSQSLKDAISARPYSGIKMLEFSWMGTEYAKDIMNVLGEKGPLHVLTAGDYAWNGGEGGDADRIRELGFPGDPFDFDGETALKDIKTEGGRFWRYLVNEDKKEYVDLTGSKLPLCWITSKVGSGTPKSGDRLHPLFILTALGNGQGGGDYIGTSDWLVGSWAGDLIGASTRKPGKEYTEIRPEFTTSPWKCFDTDKEIRKNVDWIVFPDVCFPSLEWTDIPVEEYLKRTGRVPESEERLKGIPESAVKGFFEVFPDATADEIRTVNANLSASCYLEDLVELGMLGPLADEFGGLKKLFDERNWIRVCSRTERIPDPMKWLLSIEGRSHGLEDLVEQERWEELREELKKDGFFCYAAPDGENVVEIERRK